MKLCLSSLPAVSPSTPPLLLRHALVRLPALRKHSPVYVGGFICSSNSLPRASFDDQSSGYSTKDVDTSVVGETEAATDESPAIEPVQEFWDNLNVKVDSDDIYTLVLFGGGAVVALWLASAVVGAIDSIPVFPKLMEVVGLGFTFWFTTRYLLFKKNRQELYAKIEELKQQVLGSSTD